MKIRTLTLAATMLLTSLAATAQGIVLDMSRLNDIKTGNDPTMKQAQAALIRAADKIMNEQPASVMDKDRIAPSGDKHDYFSMARYWWPNPKTDNHLPYVRHDGKNNPETLNLDREALSTFAKQVQVFALAYYFSDDERYAQKAWDCLRTWYLDKRTRMNPNLLYSQVVLGRDDNKGRKEGLLDTYSMLYINDYLTLLANAPCTRQKDIDDIRAWFNDFYHWMQTSSQGLGENNAKNNHGTAYHIQLTTYAIALHDDTLAHHLINDFVQRRIMTQIEPDGSQPHELVRTTSFGYSCFNLGHMLDMLDIARLYGIDLLSDSIASQRIQAAIDYLTPFLGRPVESWPYQQIRDWEKQQQSLCWILYRAHRYFPQKDYMDLFRQYNTDRPSNRKYIIY